MGKDAKILLTGSNSNICREFRKLLPINSEVTECFSKDCDFRLLDRIDSLYPHIRNVDKIVLAHGAIGTERFLKQTTSEIVNSITLNLLATIKIIELAIENNPKVRIVAVGSESGLKGSYDIPYALSKSALHKYVEERRLPSPDQQLVCVAPSGIVDAGMTLRRKDQDRVQKAINENPKKRGLLSREVANMIYYLLFVDNGYTTNTVIHMNGGKFARM